MPGSGDFDSSQGSTVSFAGNIGKLTGFTFSSQKAGLSDVTSMDSAVVGSGVEARVLREYESMSVDSGTASVRLLGCPPFVNADIGSRETLTIETSCGTFSVSAILESFEVEGAVGELLRGAATFTVIGEPD